MNKMIERIKAHYFSDEDWLFIRYEDFCVNTDQILKEIAIFLKIPNTFNLLPFVKERYHIIGNAMRHSFDGLIKKPLPQASILSLDIEALFNSLACEFYRKYLYI